MNIKTVTRKGFLQLTCQLNKDETFKINDKGKIFSVSIFKTPQKVRGISSMCEDGKHILMLDWDNVCRWIVEAEVKELSNQFMPFYLFKTREEKIDGELVGHYHAICLQKFCPSEIVQIQSQTSCDRAYTTMPLRNRFRSWVLRMSEKKGSNKPSFVKVVGSTEHCHGEISLAHYNLLNKLYELPRVFYPKKDNLNKIYLNEYETA